MQPVEAEPSSGSGLKIKMGLAKYEAEAASPELTVLVADDSAFHRKLVEHPLSEKRYALLFAKSGREAIEVLSEHHSSLVITEWMMPDLSGLELGEHIRDRPRQPRTYLT